MSSYLIIESRDPFESRDTTFVTETATSLTRRGHTVTVFLVQNGVLAARRLGPESCLSRMNQEGVIILADDFSLSERGIQPAELAPGIQQSNIGSLVEALVQANTKAIWH
jgi:sulfur relay (sulfurtransferase) complex TusBCD TusD component (DsrE family)